MAKLLRFFENYLTQCEAEVHALSSDASKWISAVSHYYAPNTLNRLLASHQCDVRQAAAWALSYLGDESHSNALGLLLCDSARKVRTCADDARRAIAKRTQSPWHRKTALHVEQLLADGMYASATELAHISLTKRILDRMSTCFALGCGSAMVILKPPSRIARKPWLWTHFVIKPVLRLANVCGIWDAI